MHDTPHRSRYPTSSAPVHHPRTQRPVPSDLAQRAWRAFLARSAVQLASLAGVPFIGDDGNPELLAELVRFTPTELAAAAGNELADSLADFNAAARDTLLRSPVWRPRAIVSAPRYLSPHGRRSPARVRPHGR